MKTEKVKELFDELWHKQRSPLQKHEKEDVRNFCLMFLHKATMRKLLAGQGSPIPAGNEIRAIVELLIKDLSDRDGFDHEWDATDPTTQKEIKTEWANIISKGLSPTPASEARSCQTCGVIPKDCNAIKPDICPSINGTYPNWQPITEKQGLPSITIPTDIEALGIFAKYLETRITKLEQGKSELLPLLRIVAETVWAQTGNLVIKEELKRLEKGGEE